MLLSYKDMKRLDHYHTYISVKEEESMACENELLQIAGLMRAGEGSD